MAEHQAIDERRVRVTGPRFHPAEQHTIKLEPGRPGTRAVRATVEQGMKRFPATGDTHTPGDHRVAHYDS